MGKQTAWDVIDDAVAVYRAFRTVGGQVAEMEAAWDALPRGLKSAVGRRISELMGREWCGQQVDAFDRFLGFVEVCVDGVKVAFLVKTPAPVLATAAALAGFASWAADQMGVTVAPISGGSPAADAEELAEDALHSAVAAYRFGLGRAVEDHWLYAGLPVQAAISRRITEAMGRTWRHGDGSLARFVSWVAACSEGSRVSFAPPAAPTAFRLVPRVVPARQRDLPWFEDAGRDEPPAAPAVAPAPSMPPEPPLFVTGIMGYSYSIQPIPIDPAVGSHAFELVNLDRHRVYHICRDLFGQPECDCGDHTFRRAGTQTPCKHVARLQELGMMPLAASAPLQPFARRRRFEPTPAEMAEARDLVGA